MPSFKNDLNDPSLEESKTEKKVNGQNIVTIKYSAMKTVKSYTPGKVHDLKNAKYSDIKKTFQGREDTKNKRFQLSELSRGPLSVDEEERQFLESQIEKRVNEKLGEIREQAAKDAYEEGLAAGKKDAKKEVLEQARPMLEAFEKMVNLLENARTEVFKSNEEFLTKLIYRIAKLVTLKELKEDKEYTNRLISQILERVGTRENIKIFVGREVYSAAESIKEDLAQTLGELKNISIELDSDINDRGCRVETEFGEVDARIEVQLENIADTFGVAKA